MAANEKETAAKIAALQFSVIDKVRPILPSLDQTRSDRIFPDVEPFGFRELIPSQQAIKYTILPFPGCVGLTSDKALQTGGELSDLGFTIVCRADQGVKVIGHRNCSDRVPIFVCAAEGLDRLKRRRIRKNGSAIFNA